MNLGAMLMKKILLTVVLGVAVVAMAKEHHAASSRTIGDARSTPICGAGNASCAGRGARCSGPGD